MMADWGRTLDEIMDGMTLPQFRLLFKMRQRRVMEDRRWDLQIAGFSIQSKEQSEVWGDMMESLSEMEDGEENQATMGGGFTVSKRYPLLHEITPQQAMIDSKSPRPGLLSKIRFRKVEEVVDA